MNFVHNFYFLIIIILRSRGVLQTAADFTLKELKHVSGKLKPMECMRLIEAIYSAIPYSNGREHKSVTRETPINAWISKHACLDELRAWSRQIPEKTEPKARRVMVLHLNAIGRSDLGNYLRKNDPKHNQRIAKRFTMRKKQHEARTESKSRKVRHVLKKRLTESSETWTDTVSKNLLISSTLLCLAVTFICGILMFVIRRRVKSSTCCKKNSNSRQPESIIRTQEKGLQCIGCLENDYLKRVETASQVSEIDIEGGSYDHNFIETGTQRSISGSVMSDGNETLRVSIEKLELMNEKPEVKSTKESRLNDSCSSRRSPERKTNCEPKQRKTKKRKKKVKVKAKEESKSPRGYLKVIREKILPSKEKRKHKTPNKNCGACQYCNCTSSLHRQEADGTLIKVRKRSEKSVKQEAGSKLKKREKRRKYSKNKKQGEDKKPILAHQYDSVASGSPKLDKQLKQAKTKRLKVSSRKPGASRARKVRLLSSSSETEAENVGD